MNGTELAKVQRGDPLIIKASAFNAFIDAALAHRRGRLGVGRMTTRDAGQSVVVPIKNNSGADRSRYDVLGIDGPLFDPATYPDSYKQQVALKGVTPVAGTHEGNFAILLAPIADGSIGQAAIAGLTITKVNVPDAAAQAMDFVDIKNAEAGYLLKSATGTARVVTIESGTGTKWAVVSFGNVGPSSIPAGTVVSFAGNTVPTGWFLCDGSEKNKTAEADLFAALDDGAGGGLFDNSPAAGNFNLPNCDGMSIRGFGTSPFNTVGATGGFPTLSLKHHHTGNCISVDTSGGASAIVWDWNQTTNQNFDTWNGTTSATVTKPSGGNQEVDNRGPWICMKWIIKA